MFNVQEFNKKIRCPICDGEIFRNDSYDVGESRYLRIQMGSTPRCTNCGAAWQICIKFDRTLEVKFERVG